MTESTLVEVKFYEQVKDELLKFAAIVSKTDDKCGFVSTEKEILMKCQVGIER